MRSGRQVAPARRLKGETMKTARFTGGIFACVLAAVSGAALPAPPASSAPWGKAPTLPSGCFTSDGFYEKNDGAMSAMAEEIQRQTEVNNAVEQKYRSIDPAEMQSRMMEFMTQHPQQAMEFMQKVQAMGENNTGARFQEIEETRTSLRSEFEALTREFDASLETTWEPARALMAALGDGCGARPPGPKELAAVDQVNAEYKRLCGEYYGPGGRYQLWLGKYRAFLAEQQVPAYEEFEKQNLDIWSVMKIATDTFRSTAGMTAVRDYMQEVQKIYQKRWERPWPGR